MRAKCSNEWNVDDSRSDLYFRTRMCCQRQSCKWDPSWQLNVHSVSRKTVLYHSRLTSFYGSSGLFGSRNARQTCAVNFQAKYGSFLEIHGLLWTESLKFAQFVGRVLNNYTFSFSSKPFFRRYVAIEESRPRSRRIEYVNGTDLFPFARS